MAKTVCRFSGMHEVDGIAKGKKGQKQTLRMNTYEEKHAFRNTSADFDFG